ncbi:MAG: hypothetical protein Q8K60_02370, partial [Parachlamydiaceae bacterium]|nr:hypothetical protein [Parachlamydiaceae bacterium]
MKFLRIFQLCSLFVCSYQPISAIDNIPQNLTADCDHHSNHSVCHQASHFGTAGFVVTDTSLWYTLNTNSF